MAKAPIHVYDPRISVKLLKNVTRESIAGGDGLGKKAPASARFQGMDRIIDLTPFLGEFGGVRTSKGVRDPAGGFNITLADRMFNGSTGQMETLYALIEPMDVIEIRMAHDNSPEYSGLTDRLPIVMRGFVSVVRRSESMSADGKPSRSIVIVGQDYGKLWQILQIRYLANYVMGQELLTTMKFAQNYGTSNVEYTPNNFVNSVVEDVLNKFIDGIREKSGVTNEEGEPVSPVQRISIFDLKVPDAKISPFGVNAFAGGTLHQMLSHYGDVGPWNELFIEDREDGVAVVYRPNPFFTPGGDLITEPSDGSKPVEISITDADVVALDTGRTDSNVANYFWVDNPTFSLSDSPTMRLQDGGMNPDTYFIRNYRNCAPWLYGIRMMQLQTNQGQRFDSQSQTAVQKARGELLGWLDNRRKVIVESNRDNVIFESGSITVKGNERIKAGMYLKVTRGNFEQKMYVARVDQNFMPFRPFTTTITFERGTGFINRATKTAGNESAYLNEWNQSGAYGGDQ